MMKAPHNEELPYSYCKLVEVSLKGSFSDAKMLEDVIQCFLRGDGTAGDFAKVGETDAEVFGKEVAGKVEG